MAHYQLIILGAIAMTVFLRTKMHRNSVEDGVIFLGAMFLGLVTHLFNGFAELAMSIAKLPIFYKQRDLRFYPSWAYALPTWILKIPISFLECAVWIGMTYYVIGFDPNIERLEGLKQICTFSPGISLLHLLKSSEK